MAHFKQRLFRIRTLCEHRIDLIILAAYIVVGIVFAYPLPLTMDHSLAGDDIDVWINPWVNWWTQKALSEKLPLYYTTHLFYPQGVSLVYHSFSHTNTALWLALRHVIGDLSAYNLTVLMTYPLSAFTLYLLAHHLTRSRPSAVVAGFIFGFSPYHVAESSHPVLGTVQWMPLFLLALEKGITHRRVKAGLWAAFWLWLTALSGWHLLTLAFLLGGCRAIYLVVTQRRWKDWATLRVLLIASLAFSALTLPFIWPILHEQLSAGASFYLVARREPYSGTDLAAFFTPSIYHPLFGRSVTRLYERADVYERLLRPATIGYSALVLGCIGVFRGGRRARFWWIASVVLFVLALGPYPRVLGERLLEYPLPWGIPIARLFRYAERLNILLTLCWSLLAAWGCRVLLNRIRHNKATPSRSRRRTGLAVAGILIVVAFEYCPVPFPTTDVEIPPFYIELAQEPGDFAVLEVPIGRQPAKTSMFYQTIHGRPLVDGHVSRTPSNAYDFIESNPLLSLLRQYSVSDYEGPFKLPFPDVSRQLETLADAGIRYIIFHRDSTPPEMLSEWQSFIVADPVYQDASIVVYRTHLQAGVDYRISDCPIEELALVKTGDLLPPAISQAAWLELKLTWAALASPSRGYDYRVILRDPAGSSTVTYDASLAPEWPTDRWPAGTLFTSHFAEQIDPFLPAGMYQVFVQLIDPTTAQPVGTPENIGALQVQPLTRQYAQPQMSTEVDVVFGDQIRLIGYDLRSTTTQLNLTLHWQALRRMGRDYKIFVHVSSLSDGKLVAQHDSMPRNWTYPTSWWDKNQIVTDIYNLDISGLSPGQYRVSIGVYDPGTPKRLPAVDQTGTLLPGQRAVLPSILEVRE